MRACSFANRVKLLQVGQTETRSKRFDALVDIASEMQALQRTINATVSRLRKSGSEFRVESGSFVTSDGKFVVINVCVTCLAGGADSDTLDAQDDDEDDI